MDAQRGCNIMRRLNKKLIASVLT